MLLSWESSCIFLLLFLATTAVLLKMIDGRRQLCVCNTWFSRHGYILHRNAYPNRSCRPAAIKNLEGTTISNADNSLDSQLVSNSSLPSLPPTPSFAALDVADSDVDDRNMSLAPTNESSGNVSDADVSSVDTKPFTELVDAMLSECMSGK